MKQDESPGVAIWECMCLRDVADYLDLDRVRLYSLGRAFYLTPGDPCIPSRVVAGARKQTDPAVRYRIVLSWLSHQSEPEDA